MWTVVEIELLSGEESRKAGETVAAAVNDANGRGECTSSLTLDAPQLEAGTGVSSVEASMDTQKLLGISFDTCFVVIFPFEYTVWVSHCWFSTWQLLPWLGWSRWSWMVPLWKVTRRLRRLWVVSEKLQFSERYEVGVIVSYCFLLWISWKPSLDVCAVFH